MALGQAMKHTRYAISWIYGEFRIARLKQGNVVESWLAPYAVHDLASLSRAMADCATQVDLGRGGDVAIAYEDDLHTHEFFNVPSMARKDLEKLLQRKVEQNKPFRDEAAWCYHEARHSEQEEGILLHLLPQRIVDAVIRICQEFYLTPKRMVPLTEIVSETITRYGVADDNMAAVVALFEHRTEIVVTLGNGETLFVRELSYASGDDNHQRLATDINRTIQYCKQQFGRPVEDVWLLGQTAEHAWRQMHRSLPVRVFADENSLDPLYWALEVAALPDRLSANFIPLLARKKINRALFARLALWAAPVTATAALTLAVMIELDVQQAAASRDALQAEQAGLQQRISSLQSLISRRDQSMQKLSLLQADNRNLPALFVSHLGDLLPPGLTLLHSTIRRDQGEWEIRLQGESRQSLQQMVSVLQDFENRLQQPPWNITISQGWKQGWYRQLQSGGATLATAPDFELRGWLR